jgi:hypothetical protein
MILDRCRKKIQTGRALIFGQHLADTVGFSTLVTGGLSAQEYWIG